MKIIKPGVKKSWSVTLTCTGKGNEGSGCGAELEVEVGDVFRVRHASFDDSHIAYKFRCAQCECDTDIPDSKLPYRVKEAARKSSPPRRRGDPGSWD